MPKESLKIQTCAQWCVSVMEETVVFGMGNRNGGATWKCHRSSAPVPNVCPAASFSPDCLPLSLAWDFEELVLTGGSEYYPTVNVSHKSRGLAPPYVAPHTSLKRLPGVSGGLYVSRTKRDTFPNWLPISSHVLPTGAEKFWGHSLVKFWHHIIGTKF